MQLVFTDQYVNLLLLLNGLVVLLYYGAKMKGKQRAMKFGNYETLQKVAGEKVVNSSDVSLLLRLVAFSIIVIGLSGPVIVQDLPSTDSSYALAIDASGSMTASDIEPTRLDAAKDLSVQFVENLPDGSHVGLVAYSGDIEKQSDLTLEKDAIIDDIENITLGTAGGTATGDAIITSSTQLTETNNQREIILVTDGTRNVGATINESIEFALRQNVSVNTIGLGSDEEQEIEDIDITGLEGETTGYPNLREERLFNISNMTGGEFNIVTDRDQFETAFEDLNTEEVERDVSTHLIFIGLFLLLSEWVFNTTKFRVLP